MGNFWLGKKAYYLSIINMYQSIEKKNNGWKMTGLVGTAVALFCGAALLLNGGQTEVAPMFSFGSSPVAFSRTARVQPRDHVGALRAVPDAPTAFTMDQIRSLVGDDVANQLLNAASADGEPRDVVLYGFGRIGRLMTRILMSIPPNLRVKAVVQRPVKDQAGALGKRAELLIRDSAHGINNAMIIDNTGVWRDAEGLSRHLQAKGATQVILTAPGKGMKNVVAKVNPEVIEGTDTVLSAASCTTNAVAPPLKVIDEAFGVVSGHLETVHSYTNDQNLIDNYHKADRRGRAAGLNMVISETGAGKAVSKALPNLEGKLTSNAIRVPTPDVSMAVLVLQFAKETTAEGLNAAFKAAAEGPLKDTLGFSESREAVSQDFIGSKKAGVIDAPATMCKGSACTVYIWYDNENGYSNQVVRVMETLNSLTKVAC